jgi:hypothetical protein
MGCLPEMQGGQASELQGDTMRRFRLKTLMLLIVIAALGICLVVQQQTATRREAELRARLNEHKAELQAFKRAQGQQLKFFQDKLQQSAAIPAEARRPVGIADPGRPK